MERRETEEAITLSETSYQLGLGYGKAPYLDMIAYQSRKYPNMVFSNLMHHFSVENLRGAFEAMDGTKALGNDKMTKEKYGENLEENLKNLHNRMRQMAYRPADARVVLIPKWDGGKRPIAVSNFEDKLAQKVMADILVAIYDRSFKRFSFGFRPKRSCHGAVSYLYNRLRWRKLSWVVDVDLKNFFNTIDHKKLLEVLRCRVTDKRFLRYVDRMLRSGTLTEGASQNTKEGTPQGSIVSPVLANLYLHTVLDEWFDETIRPELNGEMVRYADDFIVAFKTEAQALGFIEKMQARIKEYGLELNLGKTQLIPFSADNKESKSFDFLGFTYYWGRNWNKKRTLKVKTSMRTLQKKIREFTFWIKENRNREKLSVLWEKTAMKLRGHYNYFGVLWNRAKLYHFYRMVIGKFARWLNRRSQKKSYSRMGFRKLLNTKRLPLPPKGEKLINLTSALVYCT